VLFGTIEQVGEDPFDIGRLACIECVLQIGDVDFLDGDTHLSGGIE